MKHLLHTGQIFCYDISGGKVPCPGSGQDGAFRAGLPWPVPRFALQGEVVVDHLTGLSWSGDANINIFPCTWLEAFEQVQVLNRDRYGGYQDWRLPNRNELRSLMSYQAKKPCLPEGHPFGNWFLGWYWTSTTAAVNPSYAWSIHLEGARMFYGRKEQYQLFWPVRGQGGSVLPATGQKKCYDSGGRVIDCAGTGQDGELQMGSPLPSTRFSAEGEAVILDHLTGLGWARDQGLMTGPVTWQQALDTIDGLNNNEAGGVQRWRLPNINELASLVDCNTHGPALSRGHPFTKVHDGYWSSTTSYFETDWAWVLYPDKGACGVGHKPGKTFYVWPVTVPAPVAARVTEEQE